MTDPRNMVGKIKSGAYWRVNLRPQRFGRQLIPSLGGCADLIEASRVRLRGSDYPHFRRHAIESGDEWIQSSVDSGWHVEFWRFYQSGQFVHYLAVEEDHVDLPWSSSIYPSGRPDRYLAIELVLYQATEIFEFAARLAQRDLFRDGAFISVTINGTKDRDLVFWRGTMDLPVPGRLICGLQTVGLESRLSPHDLLSNPAELAVDAAVHIFERFNWLDVPRSLLAQDQRRLLERNF